jgi:hypothetical protein
VGKADGKLKSKSKRAKSLEENGKRRKRKRINKEEKDKHGGIISLSIIPEDLETKNGFAKSRLSQNEVDNDQERADFEVLSSPDFKTNDENECFSYKNSIVKSTTNILESDKKLVKVLKSTKNKSNKKGKSIYRTKSGERTSKSMKKIAKSTLKDSQLESKENRPLQINTMDSSRVNKFYKIQRKIHIEEHLIDELQSRLNFELF